MSCVSPLLAYRDRGTGDVRVGRRPGEEGDGLELACGTCICCRQTRARAWSLRIMHESMSHDVSRFATFSYAPEKLRSLALVYRDYQLFMKRLRKAYGRVRFFCAGEYGALRDRPHFHSILFGLRFRDERVLYNGDIRSEDADALWSHGHVHIGEVTPASAQYVASYSVDKLYGRDRYEMIDGRTGEVFERRPPFVSMSRRPGIGAAWFNKFVSDVLPRDYAVDGRGRRGPVPRYYLEKWKQVADAVDVEWLQWRRFERAKEAGVVSEERREVLWESAWRSALRRSRVH